MVEDADRLLCGRFDRDKVRLKPRQSLARKEKVKGGGGEKEN